MTEGFRLCLTPGDPIGIGPEITVRFLTQHRQTFLPHQFVVIGDLDALRRAASHLNVALPEPDRTLAYQSIRADLPGKTAYLAIESAIQQIVESHADALVTGPISKDNLAQAGVLASGHTEILEQLARQHYPHARHKAEMLFVHERFRLLLLTRHIPLSAVPEALTTGETGAAFETLSHFLTKDMQIKRPRIAVLGVNPHAGEIGGVEEDLVLKPLINQLNQAGPTQWEGPFAADAFFRGFNLATFPYDAVMAAYHDQGLIPFKLIAGYQAVNVTLGLPFIRTSVGHGTAEDIVGQGIASPESLVAAVKVAITLADSRKKACSV